MDFETIKALELVTIVFGLATVCISLILAHKFVKINIPISEALSFQLLAEGFIGIITVIFAVSSWLGLYNSLLPEMAMVLRWLIFGVAALTSINLYTTIKNIERRD